MDISTRLLALIAELMIVPADIPDKKTREIFDKISDNHSITSYSHIGPGVQMSTKPVKSNLVKYIIMKDRVVLSYEFCENSMNYYSGLISDFLDIFVNTTGIKVFIMQSVTVRKLVNIGGIKDARDFLIKNVYSFKEENLQKLGRPLHLFGSRIFFPQMSQDTPSYDVKIETAMDDHRTMFIENKGIFTQAIDIKSNGRALDDIISKTSGFIDKNITDFITQFI